MADFDADLMRFVRTDDQRVRIILTDNVSLDAVWIDLSPENASDLQRFLKGEIDSVDVAVRTLFDSTGDR